MATNGSQQLEKSEQDKYELQRKLKSALAAGPSAAQKVCLVWFWTYKRIWHNRSRLRIVPPLLPNAHSPIDTNHLTTAQACTLASLCHFRLADPEG